MAVTSRSAKKPSKAVMSPSDFGEDVIIDVECGQNKGTLYLNRLQMGSRGPCVLFDNAWLTPNEFQFVSGRETAKDWKRSIKHFGKSLKILLSRDLMSFQPPFCRCDYCAATGGTGQQHQQPQTSQLLTEEGSGPLSPKEDVEEADASFSSDQAVQTSPGSRPPPDPPLPSPKADSENPVKRRKRKSSKGSVPRNATDCKAKKPREEGGAVGGTEDGGKAAVAMATSASPDHPGSSGADRLPGSMEAEPGAEIGEAAPVIEPEGVMTGGESSCVDEARYDGAEAAEGAGKQGPKKEKRLTNIIAELRNSKKHLRSKSEEHQSSEEMSFTEHEGSIRDRESPKSKSESRAAPLSFPLSLPTGMSSPPAASLPHTLSPAFSPSMLSAQDINRNKLLSMPSPTRLAWYLPYYMHYGMMTGGFTPNPYLASGYSLAGMSLPSTMLPCNSTTVSTTSVLSVPKFTTKESVRDKDAALPKTAEVPLDLSTKKSALSSEILDLSKRKGVEKGIAGIPPLVSNPLSPLSGAFMQNPWVQAYYTSAAMSRHTNPHVEAVMSWSSEEVVRFISSVENCSKYAKNFRESGITGNALPFLSVDHLVGLLQVQPSDAAILRSAIDRLLQLPGSSISSLFQGQG